MALKQHVSQVAMYKGRKYPLLWQGDTRYGRRAKLGFWDGSREFWVDASLVRVESNEPRPSSSYGRDTSPYCGYPCPVTGRKCCPSNGPCHDCE